MSKSDIILDYARRHGISTVVETGTAYGFTAAEVAASEQIDVVWTCEIEPERYYGAVLHTMLLPKVHCVLADSRQFVVDAAFRLGPTVWFLDAHSVEWVEQGEQAPEVPLLDEIKHIAHRNKNDVILIDDARLLGTAHGWPRLDEVLSLTGSFSASTEDDMVRLVR